MKKRQRQEREVNVASAPASGPLEASSENLLSYQHIIQGLIYTTDPCMCLCRKPIQLELTT